MHQFADHLLALRDGLPLFTARRLALDAHAAMHLLTPHEAAGLWDQRMQAMNASWRRLPRR